MGSLKRERTDIDEFGGSVQGLAASYAAKRRQLNCPALCPALWLSCSLALLPSGSLNRSPNRSPASPNSADLQLLPNFTAPASKGNSREALVHELVLMSISS